MKTAVDWLRTRFGGRFWGQRVRAVNDGENPNLLCGNFVDHTKRTLYHLANVGIFVLVDHLP